MTHVTCRLTAKNRDQLRATCFVPQVDAVRAKLMRHLTAVLQTNLLRQHDDEGRLSPPAMTSPLPPEPETQSCDSSGGAVSPTSSDRSPGDADDLACVAGGPTSTDAGHRRLAATATSPPPPRATSTRLPVESPAALADRGDGPSPAVADRDLDSLPARSASCCVWRPW